MKILCCGDRNWINGSAIRRELEKYPQDTVVIHGAARGADSIAGSIAKSLGMQVEIYPAQWNKYGKGAGPVRNKQMLDEGKPDWVLAFHENIESSKGTKHMVKISEEAGIPVEVFKS